MQVDDRDLGREFGVIDADSGGTVFTVSGPDAASTIINIGPATTGGMMASWCEGAGDGLLQLFLSDSTGLCWLSLRVMLDNAEPRIQFARMMGSGFTLTTADQTEGLLLRSDTGETLLLPPIDLDFERFRRSWRGSGRYLLKSASTSEELQLPARGAIVRNALGTPLFELLVRKDDGAPAIRFSRMTITLCGASAEIFANPNPTDRTIWVSFRRPDDPAEALQVFDSEFRLVGTIIPDPIKSAELAIRTDEGILSLR